MAVQLNYIAPAGWNPPNADEDFVIVQYKIELAEGVPEEKFVDAAASIAAESSTGTWTTVDAGPDSGMDNAEQYKALAYDLNPATHMFKIAYKAELFELDNMSGFLAGPLGNVAGMKMSKGLRVFDIRFPKKIIEKFPGPRFGIPGIREIVGHNMPILGTVPKPKVGRTAQQQALLARRLWTAGDGSYDFIKDDENLTSLPFNKFEDRANAILTVQKEIEQQTGKKKLYLCNITHSDIDIMLERANLISSLGGFVLMMDVVTTGFAAVHTIRKKNPGLAIHAHRAMHGFITRESGDGIRGIGHLQGFSVSMLTLAKIYRLLGVDSLHVGSPKSKMQDYGESEVIAKAVATDQTPPDPKFHTLGQKWFGIKPVWPTASGGLHPGVMDTVIAKLGNDIFIQLGGGVLGHPDGVEKGVEAALEARKAVADGISFDEFVNKNPRSALAAAIKHWGREPKIVY